MFDIPILFIVYNRPEHTKLSLEIIKKIKPLKLYIAADGPKDNIADETNCEQVRALLNNIDWSCEVKRSYNDTNRSSKRTVSAAINWMFSTEEFGIILEDDCLPDPSFFTFCKEMLLRYKNDLRMMHINGTNFLQGKRFEFFGDSYYYSNIPHPWGWATWKRAWSLYDIDMIDYAAFKSANKIGDIISKREYQDNWMKLLLKAKNNEIDCWDYQWFYTIWSHNGIVITPTQNLVTNIGFGNNATNTTYRTTRLGNMRRHQLTEIIHPSEIKINRKADDYATLIKMKEGEGNLLQKFYQKLKLILHSN